MASVGVAEAPALGIEYAIEASDEHVRWDVRIKDLVGLRQHLSWRGTRPLSDSPKHADEKRSLEEALLEELYSFVGDGWEQEDDITLLTLRRSAASR